MLTARLVKQSYTILPNALIYEQQTLPGLRTFVNLQQMGWHLMLSKIQSQ